MWLCSLVMNIVSNLEFTTRQFCLRCKHDNITQKETVLLTMAKGAAQRILAQQPDVKSGCREYESIQCLANQDPHFCYSAVLEIFVID